MTAHDIAKSMNNHKQIDVAILDFAKAFDKVPHMRLLHKLELYGIRDKYKAWIKNFLTNRTQRVVIEGNISTPKPVTSGVPQGTVLGPILFLIYVNDITENIKCNIRLFADDCLLYKELTRDSDCKILQDDLSTLCQWSEKWQMCFNVDKCHIMKIGNKVPSKYNYQMLGKELKVVNNHPYLGVEIDKNLNWNQHIINITNKATWKLNFLQRNMHKCPPKIKERVYNTLVKPGLEYCAAVWDPYTKTNIDKIEKVQLRAARFVYNKPYNKKMKGNQVGAASLVTKLNWTTLEKQRKDLRLIMLYKIANQKISVPKSYLPEKTTTTSRNRNQNSYVMPRTTIDTFKYSMIPKTILDWNQLPLETTMSTGTEAFKHLLKTSQAVHSIPDNKPGMEAEVIL